MRFFTGMHDLHHVGKVAAAFVSVNRLRRRARKPFIAGDWIMDSGAFTEISQHGDYRHPAEDYAAQIRKWAGNGRLLAAVAQDFMCEAWILQKVGRTVEQHQRMTVERFDQLAACDVAGVYLMPVLQGFAPADYVRHIAMYGDRLPRGAWVGVGSVCKRNGDPRAIEEVLLAIKRARPDLRLHGFGLKTTALQSSLVVELLETADSMAWSFAARRQGRDPNCPHEAIAWTRNIGAGAPQLELIGAL
ncbi:DUF7221 family queuine tRNA-ribosyltransferase-like protein [Roseateles violae]|uniref:DeoxyPurine in DNA protein A domain-containing protein n=1 Tax=Roseateles violae TaxID=3058042 RepID=A0ABT8E0B5_9BURK|nr:hypothetical protein [Pelomonas sp. PFR6]MDN3923302.1 hypothetical protein [Pelomonas sp. PFR6]